MSDERRRAITSTPRLTPDDVASRTFSSSFRGVAEAEVKAFLRRVADDLTDARRRESELEAALAQAETAAATPRPLTEDELLDALGEETSRLLHTARDAARDIRTKAEENAARMLAEAQESAQQMRDEAEGLLSVRRGEAEAAADAIRQQTDDDVAELRAGAERAAEELRLRTDAEIEALRDNATLEANNEVEQARTKARELVDTARDLRERVLADLAHRRTLLSEQIGELRAGREKLLEAYRIVKRSFLDATEALAQVEGRAAQDRPEAVDPAALAAAMSGEDVAVDDTAAELADAVEPEPPEPVPTEPASGEPGVIGVDSGDVAVEDDVARHDADDIFARIRAQREADAAAVAARAETVASNAADETRTSESPEPSGSLETDSLSPEQGSPDPMPPELMSVFDDTPSSRASAAVAELVANALKSAKRIAQDEQNELLDALRRQKGRPNSTAVLGERASQAQAWSRALADGIASAYIAGSVSLGGRSSGTLASELVIELVGSVLDPVRARFAQAIDESEDANEAIERLNARAREFRTQQLEGAVFDILAGVFARGAYESAPDTAVLQWVLAAGGCGADCADNVLEPTAKGAEFPTGHRHPPSYPGCRCSLIVAVVEVG
jgi:DivIVA domain-containing protein